MSYSFVEPCTTYNQPCAKKDVCTDRHCIMGAIQGIHGMPFGVGHLGDGTVELRCSNKTVDLPPD